MSDSLQDDINNFPTGEFYDQAFNEAMATKLASVMQEVYTERPEFWPYGLTPNHFKSYNPVIDTDTMKVAGFVGWQELSAEEGKKVGYYSVGLLPEFRGKGHAYKAVKSLIADKRASVSEVRALIHQDNVPSIKLAERLGVPADVGDFDSKSANRWSQLVNLLGRATKGTGRTRAAAQAAALGAAGVGLAEWENRTLLEDADDKLKGINRVLGLTAGLGMRYFPKTSLGGITGKQVAQFMTDRVSKGVDAYKEDAPLRKAIADINLEAAKLSEKATSADLQASQIKHDMMLRDAENKGQWSTQDKLLAGLLGLGTLTGGVYAYNALKSKSKKPKPKSDKQIVKGDPDQRRRGTVTIKLPYASLPQEFGRSIVDADDMTKALTAVG